MAIGYQIFNTSKLENFAWQQGVPPFTQEMEKKIYFIALK